MTSPRLTVAQQFLMLKASEISPGKGSLSRGGLTWRYDARPSPLSRCYGLVLTYYDRGVPDVIVERPDLVGLAQGRRIPHVYSEVPVRLCLYWPKAGEWTPNMLLAKTLVPWSFLWLYYFEDWLATGEWGGGGMHPGDRLPVSLEC